MRTATITIHPDAITHNVNVIRTHLQPHTRLLAMIKANAYGHGVAAVVPALTKADALGVATFAEAMAVKRALAAHHMDKPVILIEGVFSENEWLSAIDEHMGAVVHCQQQVNWACQTLPAIHSNTRTLWLKYNTGMNRLGFDATSLPAVADRLIEHGYKLILTTHFACADDSHHPANALQINAFNTMYLDLKAKYADAISASLCNSAGLFQFPQVHYDWVRAGIALYGASPISNVSNHQLNLKPAMTLSAKIMATHQLGTGAQVGYGGLWTVNTSARIGIISIGYGDGYPRVVSGAKVGVHTPSGCHLTDIVGRVAMDMIAIDLSTLPDADIGTTVTLWGETPSIDAAAAAAGTIAYELMCRLSARPTRHIAPYEQYLD